MTKAGRSPGNHRSGMREGEREGGAQWREGWKGDGEGKGTRGNWKVQGARHSLYNEETAGLRLRRTGSSHYRRSSSSTRLSVLVARHANVERPARPGPARCTCSCSYTPFISYGRSPHTRTSLPFSPSLLRSRSNLGQASSSRPLVQHGSLVQTWFSLFFWAKHVPRSLVFFFFFFSSGTSELILSSFLLLPPVLSHDRFTSANRFLLVLIP